MSFSVRPVRSPGMMLLCLIASRIYNTLSILIGSRKKKLGCCSIAFLALQGRSRRMMLLFLSVSRIYNTFSLLIRSRKKKLCSCSISFLVYQGGSPGIMLWCLSASRIYNTFSISIGSRKRNKAVGLYPFSGAPNENIVQNHLNISLLNVFSI